MRLSERLETVVEALLGSTKILRGIVSFNGQGCWYLQGFGRHWVLAARDGKFVFCDLAMVGGATIVDAIKAWL